MSNGWGQGSVNNNIGWGQSSTNTNGYGTEYCYSWSGDTNIGCSGGNFNDSLWENIPQAWETINSVW